MSRLFFSLYLLTVLITLPTARSIRLVPSMIFGAFECAMSKKVGAKSIFKAISSTLETKQSIEEEIKVSRIHSKYIYVLYIKSISVLTGLKTVWPMKH